MTAAISANSATIPDSPGAATTPASFAAGIRPAASFHQVLSANVAGQESAGISDRKASLADETKAPPKGSEPDAADKDAEPGKVRKTKETQAGSDAAVSPVSLPFILTPPPPPKVQPADDQRQTIAETVSPSQGKQATPGAGVSTVAAANPRQPQAASAKPDSLPSISPAPDGNVPPAAPPNLKTTSREPESMPEGGNEAAGAGLSTDVQPSAGSPKKSSSSLASDGIATASTATQAVPSQPVPPVSITSSPSPAASDFADTTNLATPEALQATQTYRPEEAAPIGKTAAKALATADATASLAPVAALHQDFAPAANPVHLGDDAEAAAGASTAKSSKTPHDQRTAGVEHGGRKASPDPAGLSSPETDKPAATHLGPEKSNPHSLSPQSQSQPTNTSPGGEAMTQAGAGSGAPAAALSSPAVRSLESAPGSSGASSGQATISHGEPNPAATAPMLVQSARVLERAGNSEMRVGVNTANFGNIELQTHVSQDHVGASITTSHAELRAAMVAEMPSLERAMAQHHLRLDNLDLNARAGGEDRGAAGDNPSRPQPDTRPSLGAYRLEERLDAKDNSAPAWMTPYSSGLNVHA